MPRTVNHCHNRYMAIHRRRTWVDRGQWVTSDLVYFDGMPRTVDPCHNSYMAMPGVEPGSTEDGGSLRTDYTWMACLGPSTLAIIHTWPCPASNLGRQRTVGHLGLGIFRW